MRLAVGLLVFLGIVAAVAASALMFSLKVSPQQAVQKITDTDTSVVIAAQTIEPLTRITTGMVTVQTVKKSQAPAGTFTTALDVLGEVSVTRIEEGHAVKKSTLLKEGLGFNFAAGLPRGMRAITVNMVGDAGLSGLIYPGSRVDVLASFDLSKDSMGKALSTFLLQNVLVLAVGLDTEQAQKDVVEKEVETKSSSSSSSNRRESQIALLVNAEQAKALQLANKHGTLAFVMRNPWDREILEPDVTLLNEGRLALLGEFMADSILSREDETPPTPAPEPTPAPKPDPTPAPQPPAIDMSQIMSMFPKAPPTAPTQQRPEPEPAPVWNMKVYKAGVQQDVTIDLKKETGDAQ